MSYLAVSGSFVKEELWFLCFAGSSSLGHAARVWFNVARNWPTTPENMYIYRGIHEKGVGDVVSAVCVRRDR